MLLLCDAFHRGDPPRHSVANYASLFLSKSFLAMLRLCNSLHVNAFLLQTIFSITLPLQHVTQPFLGISTQCIAAAWQTIAFPCNAFAILLCVVLLHHSTWIMLRMYLRHGQYSHFRWPGFVLRPARFVACISFPHSGLRNRRMYISFLSLPADLGICVSFVFISVCSFNSRFFLSVIVWISRLLFPRKVIKIMSRNAITLLIFVI